MEIVWPPQKFSLPERPEWFTEHCRNVTAFIDHAK
jgi:hypothetical protein